MPKVRKFRFFVQASKEVIVDGFSDKQMARVWLIDHISEECDDMERDAYVSDGVEK